MDKLRMAFQKHKLIVWIMVFGYIVFNGCFAFPFANELFKFDYNKFFMVIVCYGIIGLCFSVLLEKNKGFIVLSSTLFFTAVGLVCRYFLEYGEVSNAMNFVPVNIALYLIIIPLYCMLVYWGICKWGPE